MTLRHTVYSHYTGNRVNIYNLQATLIETNNKHSHPLRHAATERLVPSHGTTMIPTWPACFSKPLMSVRTGGEKNVLVGNASSHEPQNWTHRPVPYLKGKWRCTNCEKHDQNLVCVARTRSYKTENWDIINSPSTHSCSMSVSMAATRSPTDRAPNTKSPIKRTFPQCLWMWQPRENRRAWNLARIHRGAFWPTAFPWKQEGKGQHYYYLQPHINYTPLHQLSAGVTVCVSNVKSLGLIKAIPYIRHWKASVLREMCLSGDYECVNDGNSRW